MRTEHAEAGTSVGKHRAPDLSVVEDTEDADDLLLALEEEEEREAQRIRRRRRRLAIGFGVTAIVLALVLGGTAWSLAERYVGNVDRIGDVFEGIPEGSRPAPASPTAPGVSGEPVTFLLMGSDSRAVTPDGQAPDGRADAIMIARIGADRQQAQVVSIPRDSWVDIPGSGMNKINAAYAFGGPTLLIRTVEQLTGVRIDHFVAIDFQGLAEVTDALGGVDVTVAETTTNGRHTFEAGVNHLTGEDVRYYLGQRYGLPGGDFDRVKRQQQFIKAVMEKLISSETFGDLGRLDLSLRSMADAVAVDSGLGNAAILRLAYSLRGLEKRNLDFFTAPILGLGREGAASVVYLDDAGGQRMWEYLRTDSLGENAREFAPEALGRNPR